MSSDTPRTDAEDELIAIIRYAKDDYGLTCLRRYVEAESAQLRAKVNGLEYALVLAEQCAQWHVGDGDECGEIARHAISAIEAVRSKERT